MWNKFNKYVTEMAYNHPIFTYTAFMAFGYVITDTAFKVYLMFI